MERHSPSLVTEKMTRSAQRDAHGSEQQDRSGAMATSDHSFQDVGWAQSGSVFTGSLKAHTPRGLSWTHISGKPCPRGPGNMDKAIPSTPPGTAPDIHPAGVCTQMVYSSHSPLLGNKNEPTTAAHSNPGKRGKSRAAGKKAN